MLWFQLLFRTWSGRKVRRCNLKFRYEAMKRVLVHRAVNYPNYRANNAKYLQFLEDVGTAINNMNMTDTLP
jgi:dsRNA-specific ribonuclease